jgi:hypothetical protein
MKINRSNPKTNMTIDRHTPIEPKLKSQPTSITIREYLMTEASKGHRKLVLVALIIVDVLAIIGIMGAYSMLQQLANAKLELDDFSYYNHGPDAVIDSSYVSVSGKVRNLELETIDNVSLVIEIWVPVQNTNNMDLPLADRMILIQRQTFSIGSIEEISSKEFQFSVPYLANPKYDTAYLQARAYFS